MNDSQKFTMTITQLRQLIEEGTAPAAVQGAEADATPQQQSAFKKMLTDMLNRLVGIGNVDDEKLLASLPDEVKNDPEKLEQARKEARSFAVNKLVAVMNAIVNSEGVMDAIKKIRGIQQQAQQQSASAKQELAKSEQQLEQPPQAQQTNEDDDQPWGSWEPSDEDLADYFFDHYEECAGIPKSVVYDCMLTGEEDREIKSGYRNLVDLLEGWGIEKARYVDIFACLDKLFLDNKPEEIDEGLWDRFKAKVAGAAGTAQAVGNNVLSWAHKDAQGNSDVAKQDIQGRGQTAKFSTLINQYIQKITILKTAVQQASAGWKRDPNQSKAAALMIQKIDAFIKQAQDALKQTKDELAANNYNRKAQGGDQGQQDQSKEPAQQSKSDSKADTNKGDTSADKSDDKSDAASTKNDTKADDKDKVEVKENTKLTLTLAQLMSLVEESRVDEMFEVPDDGEEHTYEVWFDQEIKDSGEPGIRLSSRLRKDAFVKISEIANEIGEYPVDILEDGECIYADYSNWVDSDQIDEGLKDFFGKVGNFFKGAGQKVGNMAVRGAKTAISTTAGAAKELSNKKAWSTKTWTVDDYATKLARIVAELEMDLKDMGWSAKQNPGLGKVIKDLEVSANDIHGKGEQGQASNWDKIRHGVGKLTGAAVVGTITGIVLNTLMGPLRAFMSPRAYAALIAATTVLLRALMRNITKMDITLDEREKAAAEAAIQNAPETDAAATPPPLPNAETPPPLPGAATPPPLPSAASTPAAPAAPAASAAPQAQGNADADLKAKRSAAAKKGAQTRKANLAAAQALHQKRSDAAKKAAQTRAARGYFPKRGEGGRFAKVNENTKFTLTIAQLRKLVKEATEGGFDITKYITPTDVVAAAAAGAWAYIRNKPTTAKDPQAAAAAPSGPAWGSQEWRDEMIRQGKMVERDGVFFHVNKSGQPLEAYKFFKGGSYAKLPIADVDDAFVDGPEDWWDFDKAGAVLVSPDGTAQKLDPDFLGRLEGVLDKNFGGRDAMNAIGKEVRQAAAAASGLDPEVAAAQGLHDGTGKAFAAAGTAAKSVQAAIDPTQLQDGGIVTVNGNQFHMFKAPDGSVIRVNPYQVQAAGGDPLKAAMNQLGAKASTTFTTASGMPVNIRTPRGVDPQAALADVRRRMGM